MNIPEISAAEAAAFINHGEWIGVGGFGPAGAPKTIPPAIAAKARKEHEAGHPFKVNIVTGASIGASCDGELAAADAIDQRLPFSVNPEIRKAYNSGRVRYTDLNLSDNATFLRQGLTGPVDWGIIEACDIQEVRGRLRIFLTAGIGIAPTICHSARKGVFVELNTWHSTKLIGMHDIYEIEAPWYRSPIRITQPVEIIGMPYIEVSPEHIKGIILTHQPDEARSMTPSTETTDCIGQHMADFLVDNMQRGYINSKKLILQSGVGRPDAEDIKEIRIFAETVKSSTSPENVHVPGNRPYKPEMNVVAAPLSLPSCTACGACAKICSTDAISNVDGKMATDAAKCILCMACIHACPKKARILPPPLQQKTDNMLAAFKAVRNKNETFF